VATGEADSGAPSPLRHELLCWCIENNSIFNGAYASSARSGAGNGEASPGPQNGYVCIAPLGSKGNVFGAVQASKATEAFSLEDEEVMRYIADSASRAYLAARHRDDERNFEIHVTNILVNAMENHVERAGHSSNVTNYALLIANQLDLSTERKLRLHKAALLHDIGALKLQRESSSPSQYRKHAEYGYELLKPITFYADIAPIVLHHHEWHDGQGYPCGLKGEEIPLESRIIAVAEAFDAIINKCAYAKWQSPFDERNIPDVGCVHEALDVLTTCAGTQFDPSVVRVLGQALDSQEIECLCHPEAHA
jgi:putative nucleotidyltransferase with HDIG domain